MGEILIDFSRKNPIERCIAAAYDELELIYPNGKNSPLAICRALHTRLYKLFDSWTADFRGKLKATPHRKHLEKTGVYHVKHMMWIEAENKEEEEIQQLKDKLFIIELGQWVKDLKNSLPLIFPNESVQKIALALGNKVVNPMVLSNTELYAVRTNFGRSSKLRYFTSCEGSIYEGKSSSVETCTEMDMFWRVKSLFKKRKPHTRLDNEQFLPNNLISLFSSYAALEVIFSSREPAEDYSDLSIQAATFTRGILSAKIFESYNENALSIDPAYLMLLMCAQARQNFDFNRLMVKDNLGFGMFVGITAITVDFAFFTGRNLLYLDSDALGIVHWPSNRNREVYYFPTLESILNLNQYFLIQLPNLYTFIFGAPYCVPYVTNSHFFD